MYTLDDANLYLEGDLELEERPGGHWIEVTKGFRNMPNFRPTYEVPLLPVSRWLLFQAGLTPEPGTFSPVTLKVWRNPELCSNALCCNPAHFREKAEPLTFRHKGRTKGLSFEERELIRNDRARGKPVKEIAEYWERNPATIRKICLYLGVYAKDNEAEY